jgi:hypothetical protein
MTECFGVATCDPNYFSSFLLTNVTYQALINLIFYHHLVCLAVRIAAWQSSRVDKTPPICSLKNKHEHASYWPEWLPNGSLYEGEGGRETPGGTGAALRRLTSGDERLGQNS